MPTAAIAIDRRGGLLARLGAWLSRQFWPALKPGSVHAEFSSAARELQQIAAVLDRLGEHEQAGEARQLAEAVADRATRIVVFGEFSVGKSTLINAMLGELALRFTMLPATAVPIEIRHAATRTQGALYRDGRREAISRLEFERSEALDIASRAREGLARLNITTPNPLLQHLVLIDTPGLLDAQAQSGKAMIEAANADVVVLVVSSRKPWSETERQMSTDWLIRRLGKPVLVVLNGINMIRPNDRRELRQYMATAVAPLVAARPRQIDSVLYEVDALPALRWTALGEGGHPQDDFTAFKKCLEGLRGARGDEIVKQSRLRRIGDLLRTIHGANEGQIGHIRAAHEADRARFVAAQSAQAKAQLAVEQRLEHLDTRIQGEHASIRHEADRFKPGGSRFPNELLEKQDPAHKYRERLDRVLRQGGGEIAAAAAQSFARLAGGNGASLGVEGQASYAIADDQPPPPREGMLKGLFRKVTGGQSEHVRADAEHRRKLMAQCRSAMDAQEAHILSAFEHAVVGLRKGLEAELEAVRTTLVPPVEPLSPNAAQRIALGEQLALLVARFPAPSDSVVADNSSKHSGKPAR